MNHEQFQMLYEYNDWANLQILNVTARLSGDAYDQFFEFGQSWRVSVRGLLTHLMGADLIWLRRWRGSSLQAMPPESDFPTFHDLRKAWEFIMQERRDFIRYLTDYDLIVDISYQTTKGASYTRPLWQSMLHVINHSTEHRAHLALLLAELDSPVPPLDLIIYLREQMAR
jgi:uncharacterized damage-inducible protein DinB